MGVSVTIKNEEPVGSSCRASVQVVTVGDLDEQEQKHFLDPQGSVTVLLSARQFLLVDETEAERG